MALPITRPHREPTTCAAEPLDAHLDVSTNEKSGDPRPKVAALYVKNHRRRKGPPFLHTSCRQMTATTGHPPEGSLGLGYAASSSTISTGVSSTSVTRVPTTRSARLGPSGTVSPGFHCGATVWRLDARRTIL
jgi:hypothetical protein